MMYQKIKIGDVELMFCACASVLKTDAARLLKR